MLLFPTSCTDCGVCFEFIVHSKQGRASGEPIYTIAKISCSQRFSQHHQQQQQQNQQSLSLYLHHKRKSRNEWLSCKWQQPIPGLITNWLVERTGRLCPVIVAVGAFWLVVGQWSADQGISSKCGLLSLARQGKQEMVRTRESDCQVVTAHNSRVKEDRTQY